MNFYYISFATETQFLGVALVRAKSAIAAIKKTKRLGINPGGQAAIFEVRNRQIETPSGPAPKRFLNRLLQRPELEECFGRLVRRGDLNDEEKARCDGSTKLVCEDCNEEKGSAD